LKDKKPVHPKEREGESICQKKTALGPEKLQVLKKMKN